MTCYCDHHPDLGIIVTVDSWGPAWMDETAVKDDDQLRTVSMQSLLAWSVRKPRTVVSRVVKGSFWAALCRLSHNCVLCVGDGGGMMESSGGKGFSAPLETSMQRMQSASQQLWGRWFRTMVRPPPIHMVP